MAPVPHVLAFLFSRSEQQHETIPDLDVSSLELDSRTTSSTPKADDIFISILRPEDASAPALSPMVAHDLSKRTVAIHARDDLDTNYRPGAGSQSPDKFSGPGFLVLFALLGTGMVVTSIWFFFWAKNGGFKFQNEDWDDYKSTVLRRKGPDGKTLSNATKSTRLGGGSVVHGQDYMREKSMASTVVGRDEKGRKGIKAKRGFAKTHSVWGDDDYMTESWGTATVSDGMTEVTEYKNVNSNHHHNGSDHSKRYRDRDIHQYKREKPARVGGINRVADGSHYDATASERSDAYTDTSSNTHRKERSTKDHVRSAHEDAERRAKIEAHKMEKRWKREAEEAVAAIARENGEAPKRTSATPSMKPTTQKQRRDSRSSSPKKRDFSYQKGAGSETLSTAYTASNSDRTERTASYYNAYRPKAAPSSDGYGSDAGGSRRPRQSSPKKGRREGGYRRGADSDLD